MKTKIFLAVCTAAALVASTVLPVAADPPSNTELNGDAIDPGTYRAWASNYRHISQHCFEYEDEFIVVPGYDRRIPNSRGLTRGRAVDELTVTWRETRGGLRQTYEREPEPGEVDAYIHALADVRPGTYGYLASARIVAILGPEEMLVADLQLIDMEKLEDDYKRDEARARAQGVRDFRAALNERYEHRLAVKEIQDEEEDLLEPVHRLVGYPTRLMRVGDVWTGPEEEGIQVAIARYEFLSEEQLEPADRRYRGDLDEPRLMLINPVPALRRPLDEQGMLRLLDARGMNVAGFVELMREVRGEVRDRDEADQHLVEQLLPPMPEPPEDARGSGRRSF